MDPQRCPIKYKVTCPKNGNMQDLCEGLSQGTGGKVVADKLIVTDVYANRFHEIHKATDRIHNILERDVTVACEVPAWNLSNPDYLLFLLYLRQKKPSTSQFPQQPTLFGHPQIVSVPRKNLTYET